MQNWLKYKSTQIAEQLVQLNQMGLEKPPISGFGMKKRVTELISLLQSALFPSVYESDETYEKFIERTVHKRVTGSAILFNSILTQVFYATCMEEQNDECCDIDKMVDELTEEFIGTLPKIREILITDIQAAFDGDPAAKTKEDIMLSYPCITAITVYRLAHELWIRNIPLIPRIMTEYAHAETGIDIHPGAVIGERFFIDHGTGVVIGETCVIGKNVKLYQGVTLGAKSFLTDEKGTILAIKRHPNIEDNVIIYSGATILGGDTTVGHDSVIGGNVWLTESVAPYSKVYNATPAAIITDGSPKS